MIKRSDSTVPSKTRRQRTERKKQKRRLLVEGLESRRLLAGEITAPFENIDLPAFDSPRNVGTVQAFAYSESETSSQAGLNDFFTNADFVPLGTGPGQEDTIDIQGRLPTVPTAGFLRTDVDTFAFDLKAGDILDISLNGAAGSMNVLYGDGSLWFGTDTNQGTPAPNSPLMTQGNAVAAQVVPEDGRYYLSVAPTVTATNYTAGLRVYRPVAEQLPIGAQQILFVDFDGAIYPGSVFGGGTFVPGTVRVPSLRESLPLLGIQENNEAALNDIITKTMRTVEEQFQTIVSNGNNGDYDATGNPGEYGVQILNSRDHADPGAHPLVTRVIIGGTTEDVEVDTIGLSSTLDVGNFKMDDIVFGVLDGVLDGITGAVEIDNSVGLSDAISAFLGLLVSHEAGHSFGMRHTTNANFFGTIMDEGGDFSQAIGAGQDDIFGTVDDVPVEFADDRFSLNEGLFGTARTPDQLANTLVVGTAGGTLQGRVFQDRNADGSSGSGDPGLGGVTVFADADGDGQLDTLEQSATTAADGTFSINAAPGTYEIVAVAPEAFAATTANPVAASVSLGGNVGNLNFGFTRVVPDVTGFKFADNDGDGGL